MSELVVRRLQVDLDSPIALRWCGGDAFRSALFNALSFSFPAGEQFFIDAVRRGLAKLPPAERGRFEPELRGFIGQEATHRRIHERMNAHLERGGLVNRWQPRIVARAAAIEHADARIWVGATAATEHFTAVFAEWLLGHREVLDGAEPRLAQLWLWHSSEESEHRSTAFDLYRALGGDERWRRRLFFHVSFHFARDLAMQTVDNLRRDGALWRRSTWASGWRTLFGRDGLLRRGWPLWKRYLRPDFHPSQGDDVAAAAWLAANATLAPPVQPGR